MRQKRFQKGSVSLRRRGRIKIWYAQWREGTTKRSKILGPYSAISKSQAEAMLTEILQPVNVQAGHHATPSFTFGAYLKDVYLPLYRKRWKESTRSTSEADIERYLVPVFGSKLLRSITRAHMQLFLEDRATQLSTSVVGHLRWHLNAIFRMAQSDGAVEVNPAAALYGPAGKPTPEKQVMTVDQVRKALSALDVRERLIFRMAVMDGMRPGEIFAIRLGKIGTNHVRIDQRVYAGQMDTPKGRKGKNTARVVALSPGTMADVEVWKTFLANQAEDAFLFPSETGKTPLRPNNLWKRDMRPRLKPFGLEWVNYQVLRRTNASLSRKACIDDKVAADQRGHGLGVSLAVYAVSDLEQKLEAVTRLESEVKRVEPKDDPLLQMKPFQTVQ
jgi:integrase